MATKTTNYNLTKPSYNESADISVINQNMDIIDEKMKEIENASGGGGGGSSVTVDSELSTTSKNPVQNKVVTQALNGKGTYSKPTGGIPKTDLASEVQTSLGKADTALQEHQDISGKADKTEVTAIFNSISDAWNSATAYTVGQYCIYNNALWKCLVANTNTVPTEGTHWTRTTIDAEISAVNSNLENIPKIKRKLLTYDGPCTSGRPIQISEDAYGQNSVYSISVVLAAGINSFDHGDVYRDNAGHIMYIPNTTQSAINIRISIVYI